VATIPAYFLECARGRALALSCTVMSQRRTATLQRPRKNPHATALGRLGGLKGGPARAASLSARQRRAIAKKAALARWSKNGAAIY
jgi:hypothetical protein